MTYRVGGEGGELHFLLGGFIEETIGEQIKGEDVLDLFQQLINHKSVKYLPRKPSFYIGDGRDLAAQYLAHQHLYLLYIHRDGHMHKDGSKMFIVYFYFVQKISIKSINHKDVII